MTPTTHKQDLPDPDAVLELFTRDAAEPALCATLTPLIRSRLHALAGGQILEVRVDDPSARIDIIAWSRLTGHELIATAEDSADLTRFFLRKKRV